MRVIRKLLLHFFLCSALLGLALSAADRATGRGDRVAFQAILVIASDEGSTDASLAAFEPKLRSLLRFKSYRRVGGGKAEMAASGESTIALGQGNSLDLWIENVADTEVSFGVRWYNERLNLANMKVTRRRGAETIIGGPKTEDGKGHYAVIITAQ